MLYKNVDICDLESILKKGVLPLDSLEENNWEEGKRASNRTDKVYLFSPKKEQNSFPKYGAALLEIEVLDAVENRILENDVHIDDYIEYIVDKVEPCQILAIYIPRIFKIRVLEYIEDREILQKITWIEMSADCYNQNDELAPADSTTLKVFAETAEIESAKNFNFFRGKIEVQKKFRKETQIFDMYNFKYIIKKEV